MNFFKSCHARKAANGQSTRAEKRELQARRILRAATHCFVRSGFQGASMQEICKEADMSPGALYRYFPSKEAIIDAIVADARKNDAEILTKMASRDDVVEGMVEAFYNHLRVLEDAGLRPLFVEIRAEAMRNVAVRMTCQENEDHVRQSFRQYLETALQDGRIRPIVPLDAVMTILMSVGEGLIMADLSDNQLSSTDIQQALRATISAVVRPIGVAHDQSELRLDGIV
ncbi:TetR/AcrR family transcriptional regulator [Notoacmeibacter sp. MSK16QG-6]|uniref:TetR/AcrR family transcriptional regulator n=1 Tax=Notoacmeibacter sp. MSK16QG-6 TaxID=2957982 RepID=UPI00209F688F|nr:TetR/AcrR family transcriptional regulator [Notoacmeibacter sp. MSK16QG-6]MCP1198471.1 TetR/AcrR family transcriptional regulator [Notoacmeibacter sp. MSK16QG-6]